MKQPVIATFRGESKSWTYEITHFSCLEPSSMHFRIRTVSGEILEARGLIATFTGDYDALPPCNFTK